MQRAPSQVRWFPVKNNSRTGTLDEEDDDDGEELEEVVVSSVVSAVVEKESTTVTATRLLLPLFRRKTLAISNVFLSFRE